MGPLAIGVAAQVLSGYLANQAQGGAIASQREMFDEINRRLEQIGEPALDPVQYQQVSDKMAGLKPSEVFQLAQAAPSQFENMKVDRTGRRAQLAALARLQEVSDQGGLTVEDRAALENIQGQIAAQDASRQQALQESFARRGISGGGQELLSRMMSGQQAANAGRMGGLQVAAEARKRALDALLSGAQIGGGLQAADTGEAQARAAAMDQLNQFNTNLAQGVFNQRGGLAVQQAQNAQNVATANTGIANQQKNVNQIQLPQQKYQNALDRIRVLAGNTANQAATAGAAGQNQADLISGIGSTIAAGANWYGNRNAPAPGAPPTGGNKVGNTLQLQGLEDEQPWWRSE